MILFFIIYGVTGAVSLIAALYLLLRRGNAFAPEVTPPVRLRHWAAAFFGVSALSYVWWYFVYITIADCHSMGDLLHSAGYVTAVALDFVTLQTTIAGMLLAMLQDRRRPVWPAFVATIPFMALCVALLVSPSYRLLQAAMAYVLLLYALFTLYVAFAVRQYGRWLRDNYADLERKEVWQSHVLTVVFLLLFIFYALNDRSVALFFVLHLIGLVLFVLLLWRVETLPQLTIDGDGGQTGSPSPDTLSDDAYEEITLLLQKHCIDTGLYLQHDLNKAQVAKAIGTNRTYLSLYFMRKETTYNAYINDLRIRHFIGLYCEAVAAQRPVVVQQLALMSGYRSYSTFSLAFKQRMGQNVTAWMRREEMEA
jgi:AraC-like DNA-binding protein